MTVNFSLCFLPECKPKPINSTVLLLREAQKEVAEKIYNFFFFFFCGATRQRGLQEKTLVVESSLC